MTLYQLRLRELLEKKVLKYINIVVYYCNVLIHCCGKSKTLFFMEWDEELTSKSRNIAQQCSEIFFNLQNIAKRDGKMSAKY